MKARKRTRPEVSVTVYGGLSDLPVTCTVHLGQVLEDMISLAQGKGCYCCREDYVKPPMLAWRPEGSEGLS